MTTVRHAVSALIVVLSVALLSVLTAIPAAANPVATPVGGSEAVTLAATGFSLAVPLIIGLTGLVLGMGLIAWGMLRGGRRPRGH